MGVNEAGGSSRDSGEAAPAQAPPARVEGTLPVSWTRSMPSISGKAIDTRYRYQRLFHAPMRPSQVAAVAAAAIVPVAAGALLIKALFEPSAVHAVASTL